MKRSSRAALLSGLIFPGIGHLALKRYLRASILIVLTLAALKVIVTSTYQRALTVVDRINQGDIPVDSRALEEMVANSAGSGAGSLIENVAVIVLVACWLVGIIDAYRLGAAQEKKMSE